MNYVKAFAGAGITTRSKPFIFYSEIGIPNSAATYAVVDGESVTVGPRRLVSADGFSQAEKKVYGAIIAMDRMQFGVAGNGKHVRSIAARYASATKPDAHLDSGASAELLNSALGQWGNADRSINPYNIPRIAVVVDPESVYHNYEAGRVFVEKPSVKRIGFETGSTSYVSTGGGEVARPMKVEGISVDDLVEEMYHGLGRENVFCAAVALWDPAAKKWELAVKNGQK